MLPGNIKSCSSSFPREKDSEMVSLNGQDSVYYPLTEEVFNGVLVDNHHERIYGEIFKV